MSVRSLTDAMYGLLSHTWYHTRARTHTQTYIHKPSQHIGTLTMVRENGDMSLWVNTDPPPSKPEVTTGTSLTSISMAGLLTCVSYFSPVHAKLRET